MNEGILSSVQTVSMMSSDFRLASVEKGYSVVAVEREKTNAKDIVALTLLIT